MKAPKVLFTGGGSGGHTMPAMAMIDAFEDYCIKNNMTRDILYVGSHKGIEKSITDKKKIAFASISTGKLRRYFSFQNFTDIFRILKGIFDSLLIMRKYRPDVVVSTGGFVSVPPVIAAWLHKIPVIIHEQTINVGLANKIASKFATKIALTFEESKPHFPAAKTVMTGIPLRRFIFEGNPQQAYKRFGFDPELPVIYFTGGGQGCHILNVTGKKILIKLLEKTQVIFQTGKQQEDYDALHALGESLEPRLKKRFVLFDFVHEELPDIFAITSVAVARSGAGTVCEFRALTIPAIFVPLPFATRNEQYKNAESMEKIDGAIIIEEKNLTDALLLKTIDELLINGTLSQMKTNLTEHTAENGSDNMISLIMNVVS